MVLARPGLQRGKGRHGDEGPTAGKPGEVDTGADRAGCKAGRGALPFVDGDDQELSVGGATGGAIGAGFTAITLVTGMLWGRPTWGAYWVWDARLTSELVLLFLYLGVIGLASAYGDARRGARAAALLSLVGLVNLPIIHYSVRWWNTLHQGSTVRMFGESSIHGSMLWALLAAALAAKLYFVWSLLGRLQLRLLSAESEKAWVARELKLEPSDA